jgi:hypothetical protein
MCSSSSGMEWEYKHVYTNASKHQGYSFKLLLENQLWRVKKNLERTDSEFVEEMFV